MAHFFALLLVVVQVKPTLPPPVNFDARWATAFETLPAAQPGYDATTAYVPLKGGAPTIRTPAAPGTPTAPLTEIKMMPPELVAVDLDRGTIRWRIEATTTLTPATGGGLVFTVDEDVIEARDTATGALTWKASLPGGAAAPLYFDTGWLLASTPAGDLAAFRASDGVLVWRKQLGSRLAGPPGPALDRLVLPLADNRLVSVLLVNGETVWELHLDAAITGMLALDDQVVFGTAAKNLTSVESTRGRQRWTWRLGGDLAGIPAADDKRIFFASRDNLLRAVDRRSGNLRWKADLGARPAGGPLRLTNALMMPARPDGPQRLTDALVMPLVSNQIIGFDPETGNPAIAATAAGEIGLQPYVRRDARQTLPQLITVSREGQLQGFGRRFEPVPQLLGELPGAPAVP
jgi:outer membrane protein assembly factor BamB